MQQWAMRGLKTDLITRARIMEASAVQFQSVQKHTRARAAHRSSVKCCIYNPFRHWVAHASLKTHLKLLLPWIGNLTLRAALKFGWGSGSEAHGVRSGQRFLSCSRGTNPAVRVAEQRLRNRRKYPMERRRVRLTAEKRAEKRGGGAEHHFTGSYRRVMADRKGRDW